MPKPRAPKSIIALLTEALGKVESGPSRSTLQSAGESADFKRGADVEASGNDGWRDTWVAPQLRQVLSYLNGTHTEIGIRVYGCGYERRTEFGSRLAERIVSPRAHAETQDEPDEPDERASSPVIVCESCGGANVEQQWWVDPNTLKPVDRAGDEDEAANGRTWCHDCDDHVELVERRKERASLTPVAESCCACSALSVADSSARCGEHQQRRKPEMHCEAVWMSFDASAILMAARALTTFEGWKSLEVVAVHGDAGEGRAIVPAGTQCRHPHGSNVIPATKAVIGPDGVRARLLPLTLWQYAAKPGGSGSTHQRCGCFDVRGVSGHGM